MPRTIWHGETGRHTHRAVTESAAVKNLAPALKTHNRVVGSHGGVVAVAIGLREPVDLSALQGVRLRHVQIGQGSRDDRPSRPGQRPLGD